MKKWDDARTNIFDWLRSITKLFDLLQSITKINNSDVKTLPPLDIKLSAPNDKKKLSTIKLFRFISINTN